MKGVKGRGVIVASGTDNLPDLETALPFTLTA
jgi:hypothetical protein